MKVILASQNLGKLKEMQALLHELPIELVSQKEFTAPPIEETGMTFVENALIKARTVSQYTHLPAIADDSGLVVPALNGAPGIYSARYAGMDATDEENIEFLLNTAKQLTGKARKAMFICVIAYLRYPDDPIPIIAQATWVGELLHERTGTNGFGYDPIFYVPELKLSSAELRPEQKNAISHRGQALTEFKKQFLRAYTDLK